MVYISIEKGKPVNVKIPEFDCDSVLKENVPTPYNLLVDSYKLVVILGRPQSGKTSHLIGLFRDKELLKKVWNNIILITPDESLKSIKAKDNIFKDIDPAKKYTDLEDIDIVREQIKLFAEQKQNSCLIIDDQMSKLKIQNLERHLTDIVANRRHYKCTIFILSQIYERIPMRVRKLINVIIVQYKPSKLELRMIFDELLEENAEVAMEVQKIAFEKPYDWLLIDVPTQQVYKKFDKLIIDKDAQEKVGDIRKTEKHKTVSKTRGKAER